MNTGDQIEVLSQQINQGNQEALAELQCLADTPNSLQSKAAFRLGLLHDGTGPMGCLNDINEAHRYYRQAADLGYPIAQFFLGNMYEFGEGVSQDWDVARSWYELAANSGEVNAQMNLARILQTGRAGLKDVEQAAIWYLEAAKQGDDQAATNLALMHFNGELAKPDLNLAIQLLEFSATQLDGVACLHLGRLYLDGVEVEQSRESGLMHLCLAEYLLPEGENLRFCKKYLAMQLEGQDLAIRNFFVEKAKAYIEYCRGLPQ